MRLGRVKISTKAMFGLAATLFVAGGCGQSKPVQNAAVACLPRGVFESPAAAKVPAGAQVYLDGSLSMAGYLDAQTADLRPLGDVLSVLAADDGAGSAHYFAFGNGIHSLKEEQARAYASPAAYRCSDRPDCDNRESRIDSVFEKIKAGDSNALHVVITDLWLSSGAVMGSPQVALGGPLADMLAAGRAIGVLGIRAPYRGPIYDMPGGGKYTFANERPLFVILIGPEAKVAAFKDRLTSSGSPAFAPNRVRYSLFSLNRVGAWGAGSSTPLNTRGFGIRQGGALPPGQLFRVKQYQVSLGELARSGGAIEGVFDASRGLSSGLVWQGPLKASTRVWVLKSDSALNGCAADAWQPYPSLSGAWRPAGSTTARLQFDSKTAGGLTPGRTYLVAASLGSGSLQRPNPATSWMRDWSFEPEEAKVVVAGRPAFMKVLNLSDLSDILEEALQRAAPHGEVTATTAFVVKVRR